MRPELIDPTLPPVVQKFLASGARLESIRLDAEGRWWHRGVPFDNKKLIDLFSSSVGRTEGGTWVLEIPPFTYPIEVEDTGYFVTSARVSSDTNGVRLKLQGNIEERLDLNSLIYDEGRGFLCKVREGRFLARFKRSAYYALAEHMTMAEDGQIVLTLDGEHFTVATGSMDS